MAKMIDIVNVGSKKPQRFTSPTEVTNKKDENTQERAVPGADTTANLSIEAFEPNDTPYAPVETLKPNDTPYTPAETLESDNPTHTPVESPNPTATTNEAIDGPKPEATPDTATKAKKSRIKIPPSIKTNLKKIAKSLNPNSHKNKYLFYGAYVSLLVIIAVAIIIPVYNATHPPLSEEFFVSDDTKDVISLDADRSSGGPNPSTHTHLVYTYDGDNVTGLKTYFEYPDEATAATALESLKDLQEFSGAIRDGKYIVVTAPEDQFKGLTASDVKQQADALRGFHPNQNTEEENSASEG